MSDILKQITDYKKSEVLKLKKKQSIKDFEKEIINIENPRKFSDTLISASNDKFGLIAEVKKGSPSKGIIRKDFNPEKIAIDYEKAGAACLSVLTDQNFFHGKSEYLEKIKKIVDLPILRKDFIIDEFQIFESRFIGADCILLIVACLNDIELNDFYNISKSLEMDALIEVHNEDELQRALKLNPKMIGINNRNLKNMTVTLDTSIKLVKKIPKNILVVSESGFKNHSDLKLMEQYGIKSFLIGETFMKSKNIQSSVENILFGRNNA